VTEELVVGHRAERDILAAGVYAPREGAPEAHSYLVTLFKRVLFKAAAGSLQCRSLTVLTWDEEGEESCRRSRPPHPGLEVASRA